jgi:hypothetical protein
MRVIAVQAQPPHLPNKPGETTHLQAKIIGVPANTPMCHAWGLCLFATANNGTYSCFDNKLLVSLGQEATAVVAQQDVTKVFMGGVSLAKDEPKLADRFKPDDRNDDKSDKPPRSIEMQVLFGIAEAAAYPSGCPDDIASWLKAGCADRGRCVLGSKKLRLPATDDARHSNPKLTGLLIDNKASTVDAPHPVAVSKDIKLTPQWSEASVEAIANSGADGPTKEGLLMSWFSTAGDFEKQRSYDDVPENTLKLAAGDGDQAGVVQLWVVVRDGRGGIDWLGRDLQVTAN